MKEGHCMHGMKMVAQVGMALGLLIVATSAVAAQGSSEDPYREWVEYHDGEISVTFRQVPLEFAVAAIQARTGFQIIVPAEASSKTLSLYLKKVPIEVAMRSLIAAIGFNSFAMTYDKAGRPIRAIVLEARPVEIETAPVAQKSGESPLPPADKEQLIASLERWNELSEEARGRIQERLRALPPSGDRDELIKGYARQLLGITD
jgi:hypothetical protein